MGSMFQHTWVNLKDLIWTLAYAWDNVTPSTLKNGWHNLWPALMFEESADVDQDFAGFHVSKEKQVIRELLEYANTMTNPVCVEVANKLSEEQLEEWMDVDKDAPIVYQLSDEEIVEMVKKREEEEDIKKRISIDRCIQLWTELITGLEQKNFITEQEIMAVYLIQSKLNKEKPKYMKQATLQEWFKKMANKNSEEHSSIANPLASTSSAPDVPDVTTAKTPDVTTATTPDVTTATTPDVTTATTPDVTTATTTDVTTATTTDVTTATTPDVTTANIPDVTQM
ncbi:Jerky protein-like 43 [Homarus americanus]|uniref:Jerky protein-like 43 n=1 Tax=Homarus americanus TaxID=6706 RepID=A0A8J5JIC0_HOMAM|nr:Jerky protein-like 43 [Homarus americanus]